MAGGTTAGKVRRSERGNLSDGTSLREPGAPRSRAAWPSFMHALATLACRDNVTRQRHVQNMHAWVTISSAAET